MTAKSAKRFETKRPAAPARGSTEDLLHCANFAKVLRYAMTVRGWGVRDLCAAIGVEVGTMTKYLRGATGGAGAINPYRVDFGIMVNLATELGVTLEALDLFFKTGDFGNGESAPVTRDQVEAWIRSRAEAGDLQVILAAQMELAQRIAAGAGAPLHEAHQQAIAEPEPEPVPFTWPREVLAEREIPKRILERVGLTDEVLDALVLRGEYNDELVENFSVFADLAEDAVRAAFEQRIPAELLP